MIYYAPFFDSTQLIYSIKVAILEKCFFDFRNGFTTRTVTNVLRARLLSHNNRSGARLMSSQPFQNSAKKAKVDNCIDDKGKAATYRFVSGSVLDGFWSKLRYIQRKLQIRDYQITLDLEKVWITSWKVTKLAINRKMEKVTFENPLKFP